MDMEEIRYLLGSTIFARAKAYLDRVEDLDCETSENGVRASDGRCARRRTKPLPYAGLAAGKRQLCERQLYLPV